MRLIELAIVDYVVVGAGVAGLRAAIALAMSARGRWRPRIWVLAKDSLAESNTRYAQGGIAAALSDEDTVYFHLQDTLQAGAGLSDPEMARILVEEGVRRVEELIEWGAVFDRTGGRLVFTLEGAHSRRRVLHAGGDATGQEIVRVLMQKAQSLPAIEFHADAFTMDLTVTDDGRCGGLLVLMGPSPPRLVHVRCRGVVLATGGSGRIFRYTTNPPFATADGLGLAFRADLPFQDMEFFQFHPTALNVPGAPHFLLTEALRGEGAWVVNAAGERFLFRHDPRGELAPRDIVARAMFLEIQQTGTPVCLDTSPLGESFARERFPRVAQVCAQFGLTLGRDRIPVVPAAHYYMGGIRTDAWGRTGLPGLYAAGEVACNGVHGANRLASNSLLDGLVFGARAGQALWEDTEGIPMRTKFPALPASYQKPPPAELPSEPPPFPDLAWKHCGLVRTETGLKTALEHLSEWLRTWPYPVPVRWVMEALNAMQTLYLLAGFAYLRQESRGAHYREDCPAERPEWRRHQVFRPSELARLGIGS
ncbi:MAG: L-aspartate oxidase [Acidobacteria bacterium]|nr:L-aspartate oxidase [Acidobacteriota bacterium]MDW7984997.1 L-aspartate oxidase [Acidobacteriota bacterium]